MEITIDREVAASYFDADAMREAPRRLRRYQEGGLRYYYTLSPGADGQTVARVSGVFKIGAARADAADAAG